MPLALESVARPKDNEVVGLRCGGIGGRPATECRGTKAGILRLCKTKQKLANIFIKTEKIK